MTHNIEVELEEYDSVQPIDDDIGSPEEPPLMSGHLQFDEIGITPPQKHRFLYVCYVMFGHLKERIV